MNKVLENGILSNEEFASYKQRAVKSRFLHQIFLGVGGATVFGVVGTLAKGLLDMAFVGGNISLAPALGLAAIGVAGIACLYIGAKYLSQTILLDQDFQAKKIGLAARGVEPTMSAPGVTLRANDVDVSKDAAAALPELNAAPLTKVTNIVQHDRVVPLAATAEKSAMPAAQQAQNFVERVASHGAAQPQAARA
jgi:hypothetical protein